MLSEATSHHDRPQIDPFRAGKEVSVKLYVLQSLLLEKRDVERIFPWRASAKGFVDELNNAFVASL